MADEISDSRFKSEMMRLIHNVIGRFDEVDKRFDGIDHRFDSLESDLRILSGQFNDVGVMAIKDHQRIDVLEKRVDDVEAGVH